VEQAIQRLPEGCRYVLTLHDIEGYTHDEISALLEISAGTSKSQLHYARQILRSALRKDETKHERNGR
jgi:RNA polymerase sigma-70 factor (ECF subfamily)